MGKNDFDRELGTYLSRRKKAEIPDIIKWVKSFVPKPTPPPVKVQLPEDVQTYEEEKPAAKPKVQEVQLEEYPSEKQNVLSFVLDKLNKIGLLAKKPKVSEEEQEIQIKQIVAKEMVQKDLRELSKIALIAIKKLPDEDRKEFKESAEFDALKKILKKHDLIK
ncbi:hypothetical protein GF358_01130 [Candidatus Woesearchaeota archaeon]|nr:hypothetical protein [Candidatus Woesearchaeota archaeon]